jgi:hypothetical protein
MKKLLIYFTVSTLFLFTDCTTTKSTLKQERKVDYKGFLTDLCQNKSPDEQLDFLLKDLDNNGISELIIAKNGVNNITVYTFNDTVAMLGQHNFETATARLFSSDHSAYPGIFCYFEGGGLDHYGYLTIRDNQVVYEELWNEDYSGISEELGIKRERVEEVSSDKQMISESRKIIEKNNDLSFQRLDQKSIETLEDHSIDKTMGNDLKEMFPKQKGFVWYYEGPNDAEKISILDDITKEGERYILTIKSCREDLTGQEALEDRISYSTIEITENQVICDGSVVLKTPLVKGNTWTTDYKVKPSKGMYKATIEIIEVSDKSIKTKAIVYEDSHDIEEQYEEITVYEKGIGMLSKQYSIAGMNGYSQGLELKRTYDEPEIPERWYLTPYQLQLEQS